MIQSRPIEVDGQFVGAAVNANADWHFVATDPRLEDLHGQHFASAAEVMLVVRQALLRARGVATLPKRAA